MLRFEILSLVYRIVRRIAVSHMERRARKQGRLPDLEEVVLFGDRWLKALSRAFGRFIYDFQTPSDIGVMVYDLYFPSPLTLAAFKGNLDIIEFWLRHGLGGVTLKTVLKNPNVGNPRPRLQEVVISGHRTLLNALGLPSEGVKAFLRELDQCNLFSYGRPVGLSIGGHSIQDYKYTFLELEKYLASMKKGPYYYELNISCPNTPYGQDITRHPDLLESLLRFMRRHTSAVISVKLSPDQSDEDILRYSEIVSSEERTLINVSNATFRRCTEVNLPETAISIGGGGLSGTPIYRRTVEIVSMLAGSKAPIIATGGVSTDLQVLELRRRGAALVGMATAVVFDPYCVPRVNYRLAHTKRPVQNG